MIQTPARTQENMITTMCRVQSADRIKPESTSSINQNQSEYRLEPTRTDQELYFNKIFNKFKLNQPE